MAIVTQDLVFKQAVIKCSFRHGVSYAARIYKTTRQWIYFWRRRYDGTLDSLREQSRRPHYHPNQHTKEELTLIQNMRRRNPKDGLVVFWVKLMQRGYKRSIPALFRVMRKMGYYLKDNSKKNTYKPKKYQDMTHPGERVQIDVKYVPLECLNGRNRGTRYYQFTAIDEYSRQRYLEGFADNSSYSAAVFAEHAIQYFKFKIECIQTDNGFEFTKSFQRDKPKNGEIELTLFQEVLKAHGIRHKQIRPYTPRHNGKVERSHRKDGERFYSCHSFYSLEDYNAQLKRYNREYNNFPMRPLGWKSPNQYLKDFFSGQTVTDV